MLSTALPEIGEKSPPKSRFSSGGSSGRSDADAAIAPLLARANLLKLRGQWEEAVAVCADAIRRSPDSASAHSLLGDIYLTQGKNGDALHWYRMALDRNPLQTGLVEKHDRLLAEQRAIATGGFTTTSLGSTNRTLIPGEPHLSSGDRTARFPVKSSPVLVARASGRTTGRVTVERTLDWFDRVFPQGRSQGMPRTLFFVSGILVAFVIAAGAFLFFALRKSDVSVQQNTVLSEVRPVQNMPSLRLPSSSLPDAAAVPPLPVAPVPPSATPTVTLFDTLSRLNGEDITVTAAQADEGRSQAQIELSLALHPGETPPATRNRILQASAKVSQAAFATLPTLQRFSVRVLLRGRGGVGEADAVNANLVFVGETSGVALKTLSTTSPVPDYTLLSAQFTNTWWASSLNSRMP
ncbi:MAG: tetratricopeptide repeat protein [Fibrella sp.]|nr:tetratricopeptide repeat protein [Armatimonadota bacterium]